MGSPRYESGGISFALSVSKGDKGDRSSFDLAQDERDRDPCIGRKAGNATCNSNVC
jgi:hypothetical protein